MKSKIETVLLIDDKSMASGVVRCILKAAGYPVLRASSAYNALAVSREYGGSIRLLVSALQIMEMCGTELTAQLERERPGIRNLFISDHADVHEFSLQRPVLDKPFTMDDLLLKVAEVLRNT